MSIQDELDRVLLAGPRVQASAFRWATVTAASPLRVRLDGEAAALDLTPDSLTGPAAVGDRVRVEITATGAVIVHGTVGAGVTDSSALSYVSGWGTPSAAAVNRSAGWGWFTGVIARTSGTSTIITTLPVGYRPSTTVQFPLVAMAGSTSDGPRGHYEISPAGVVTVTVYASSPTWSTSTWFVLPSIPWRIGG